MVAKAPKALDVTHSPELLHLAEEVRDTKEPRMLRRADEELAVVMPVKAPANARRERRPTAADYAAFRAAAGGWKDEDTEAFKAYNYEQRRKSSRPPADL